MSAYILFITLIGITISNRSYLKNALFDVAEQTSLPSEKGRANALGLPGVTPHPPGMALISA